MHQPIYPFVPAFIHLFQSSIHPFIHSFHSCVHSFICSTQPSIRFSVHSCTCSVRSFVRRGISSVHSSIHPSIHSFIHSFIHSSIHSPLYALVPFVSSIIHSFGMQNASLMHFSVVVEQQVCDGSLYYADKLFEKMIKNNYYDEDPTQFDVSEQVRKSMQSVSLGEIMHTCQPSGTVPIFDFQNLQNRDVPIF